MRTIHKQVLAIKDEQSITVPHDVEFLSVDVQNDRPCIWYMCDPQQDKVSLLVKIIGTGHPIPTKPGKFIGTVLIHTGHLVLHIFVETWQ